MAPRPPPQPVDRDASDNTRLLESMIETLQQQNVAPVQQNTVALQSLEAARVNAEVTQTQPDRPLPLGINKPNGVWRVFSNIVLQNSMGSVFLMRPTSDYVIWSGSTMPRGVQMIIVLL
ncbi:hypothetical protein LR48_Vigan10g256700 [Vigna angularis]|uniref:Uncharacterized protein n=1 Tax=Phaseolus angularis TaxID=3914 RepID=A0A0L9VNN7_PHAAN|nr:hypothetical protein LR48_Vigan10g256700 [Vigna angularis]